MVTTFSLVQFFHNLTKGGAPLSVAGKFTAEIAELTEVSLEFSAVLAGSAVYICCDLFDNT
jgi:hypothetical protein